MKTIIILFTLFILLTGCLTTSTATIRHKRYNCVRNLVEIKVPPKEAISFCSKNFQREVE